MHTIFDTRTRSSMTSQLWNSMATHDDVNLSHMHHMLTCIWEWRHVLILMIEFGISRGKGVTIRNFGALLPQLRAHIAYFHGNNPIYDEIVWGLVHIYCASSVLHKYQRKEDCLLVLHFGIAHLFLLKTSWIFMNAWLYSLICTQGHHYFINAIP